MNVQQAFASSKSPLASGTMIESKTGGDEMKHSSPAWIACVLIAAAMSQPQALQAQQLVTVHGTVIDSSTRQPIRFAYVATASGSAATECNEKGEFSFTIPAGVIDTLIVRSIGYKPFARMFPTRGGGGREFTVRLVQRALDVEGVTVTGSIPVADKLTLRTLNSQQLMASKEDDLERALKYAGVLPDTWPPRMLDPKDVITLYVDGVYLSTWSLRGVDPKLVGRIRLWKCKDAPVSMPPIPHDCDGAMKYVLSVESK